MRARLSRTHTLFVLLRFFRRDLVDSDNCTEARQVRAFAEQYVQEMALPLEAVGVVEGSIRVQLEQAQEIMTFPIPVDQPHLITINVLISSFPLPVFHYPVLVNII